eukprot:CAMPEP_0116839438 /NCGR_PEP_ID=MMETSP0418-20121206/9769_1 /TAXON_ID=1158023 /ORGANISM="Astrosyne radiata, Strain 13vi08-1A" /LENGTH=114 /DNA_ID=CAMNT_0004469553 /DNA_START=36 /DNA_END=377 /DNA_ORIENTATION=+
MSVAGAGVLGISGAIAQSGGLISIFFILVIAVLTKRSYDVLIGLSLDTEGVNGSYERLGEIASGKAGRIAVYASKFVYTFFTLVASRLSRTAPVDAWPTCNLKPQPHTQNFKTR